jgi:L-ascorbate metabolism protein UlaG (beta-lactamase superfamily)
MTRLTWLGHSTVLLETGGLRLLTDPVLRAGIGPVRRRPELADIDLTAIDAVLISHLHNDHLDLPSMRLLPRELRAVVPAGAGRLLRSSGFGDVAEMDVGGTTALGGTTIRAVPARHKGRRMPFGPSGPALGYRIDGEHGIYFAGDTDLFPEMAELAPVDLAVLPVWGWGTSVGEGHLDPERAARALQMIRPRLAVPIHWGTLYPAGLRRLRPEPLVEPPREFSRLAGSLAPEVEVRVLQPGAETSLETD